MKKIDCSLMVIKDIVNVLNKYPMCDLCIKGDKNIVVEDHTGYEIVELILEK